MIEGLIALVGALVVFLLGLAVSILRDISAQLATAAMRLAVLESRFEHHVQWEEGRKWPELAKILRGAPEHSHAGGD